MVSGKELVAEESVTSYSEVTPSSLKLVLFKKKNKGQLSARCLSAICA